MKVKGNENKIYIFTLIFTLVALIVMTTYNFSSFYENAEDNMIARGKMSLAQEAEQLNSYVTKAVDVLQVTGISVEYMMENGAGREEIEAFLEEESRRYKEDIDQYFIGIYGVFDGEYISGWDWIPPADYVAGEREWYLEAKNAAGEPVLVSPYLDAHTNTVMVSVSQLLSDGKSVISFDIALDEIQAITEDIDLDNRGYGFIIDKEGLVVAHSDALEKGRNYYDDEQMRELVQDIYASGEETFVIDMGNESFTVFTDMVIDEWFVAMIVSNSKLFEDIRDILLQNIVLCAVVFALILFFCTKTFRNMLQHMKNAQDGKTRLEKMNSMIMRIVAKAIDVKDRYTNGHSVRVAKYAKELAVRMGKNEEEQKNIYYSALLHDVGKIRVPDNIINKNSRLTEEEFSYIKLHCMAGYHILRDLKENKLIAEGAKWHHERYDGTGYPNGLSGQNIPEVARIIGVADAYDAMTSNRSYRSMMPQDKVRAEIENGKGTQFDPDIADIMLEMIDEDKDYLMRQQDTGTRKIMVVDDDPVILSFVEGILKGEGAYRLYKINSGKAALKRLRDVNPDLVILDIQMPEMNGFEVCEAIRKISDVPIVFMTGEKSLEAINRANELGIEEYLVKPFMPQTLFEILHNILQEKVDL